MITAAEWEIMRVVWAQNEVVASEIFNDLYENLNWSESTVKTLLSRLVKKGFLKTRKEGRKFYYRATASQNELAFQRLQQDLESICNKERAALLLRLIQHNALTKEDAKIMINYLESEWQTLPETVPCKCRQGQCACCLKTK